MEHPIILDEGGDRDRSQVKREGHHPSSDPRANATMRVSMTRPFDASTSSDWLSSEIRERMTTTSSPSSAYLSPGCTLAFAGFDMSTTTPRICSVELSLNGLLSAM
jgi:hypothetical protein